MLPVGEPKAGLLAVVSEAQEGVCKRPQGMKVMHCIRGRLCDVDRNLTLDAPQEFEHRFRAFVDNLKYIEEYNAKHTSHWVGSSDAEGGWQHWGAWDTCADWRFSMLAAWLERLGRSDS